MHSKHRMQCRNACACVPHECVGEAMHCQKPQGQGLESTRKERLGRARRGGGGRGEEGRRRGAEDRD